MTFAEDERLNPLKNDLYHILEHTHALWEDLRGRELFITGGTGFFGRWLLESFLHANREHGLAARATVLTRNPRAFDQKAPHIVADPAIRLLQGDVRTFDFPAGEFSHVIHAATEASATLARDEPRLMFDTIIEGARRVMEFSAQSGVSRLLFTSSGAVYGRQPSHMTHVPEDYPGAPDPLDAGSAYGEGKRAAELLCCLYAAESNIICTIARCFAFVGPFLPIDTHFAVGNFIRDALAGGPIRVGGDGTPYRSYLYAADLTIWLWTILLRGKSCRAYNLGSDNGLPIGELAKVVADTCCPSAEVQVAKAPEPGALPARYVPSTARAREELGLREYIDLPTALQKTFDWHKGTILPKARS